MSLQCEFILTNLAVVLDEKSVCLLNFTGSPIVTEWETVMEGADDAGLLSYTRCKLIRIEAMILINDRLTLKTRRYGDTFRCAQRSLVCF